MTPLILHLIGDYLLQSDWMALNKQKRFWPCFWHCLLYTLPFLILTQSPVALFVIFATHFAIDRVGAARYLVWAKNHISPIVEIPPEDPTCMCGELHSCHSSFGNHQFTPMLGEHDIGRYNPWSECSATGYHKDRPAWLTVWLLIVADNTVHLLCNQIALTYL